jgi:hypothetical protein
MFNRISTRSLFLLFLVTFTLLPTQQVHAQPLSYAGEFSYAVNIDPLGGSVSNALTAARNLNPEWLMIDFDWSVWFPARDAVQNFQSLDAIMQFAEDNRIEVCIRLLNPPQWVVTGSGPDHASTLDVILFLQGRYPESMKAVEVFPGANTSQGWGAPPSPQAYMDMLDTIQQVLVQEEINLMVIAGGLVPVPAPDQMTDMSDISFLEGLYIAGFNSMHATLSLQLIDLAPNFLQASQSINDPVLLHIDDIHNVMVTNGDEVGPVWVTAISYKDGEWQDSAVLFDTCTLLRSRLFVGLVSPVALNPVGSVLEMMTLSDGNGSAETMQELILTNHNQVSSPIVVGPKNLQSIRKEETIYESKPLRSFFARIFGFSRSWFGYRP